MQAKSWSAKELNALTLYYGTMPNIELQRTHLPERNIRAIELKAMRMGLSRKQSDINWTDEEIQILQTAPPDMNPKKLHETMLPDRTVYAISLKLYELRNPAHNHRKNRSGNTPPGRAEPWTEEERDILRKYYDSMSIPAIQAKFLPNRSCHAIENMVRTINGRKTDKWLPSEKIILRRYYKKIPVQEIIDTYLPGKTPRQIGHMAEKLGLTQKRTHT